MHSKPVDRYYRIDVVPYADAPWAPTAQGTALRWAWRIVDDAGLTHLVGSSSLPEQGVRDLAESAIMHIQGYRIGKPPKINPTLKRKGRNRATNGTPME